MNNVVRLFFQEEVNMRSNWLCYKLITHDFCPILQNEDIISVIKIELIVVRTFCSILVMPC